MEVRDAVVGDAPAACLVLRQSIAELCAADHRGDPTILAQWLANKTPEHVGAWIARPDLSLLVAVEAGAILAAGMVTDTGQTTLNYVSPDARFRGVTKAMLAALEVRAAERGATTCRLKSTQTAHRFYLSAGYADVGSTIEKF